MTDSRAERRAARRRERTQIPLLTQPYRQARNPLPPLEILDAEQLEQLHTASLDILEKTGIVFQDAEALSLWANAGAKVDHAAQQVWVDRGLVMEVVSQAPRSFVWCARNPERNIFIGENAIAFGPCGGMAYVSDLDRGRRNGTQADFENFVRLGHMAPQLHFAGWDQVTAHDIPASLRHLHRLRASFTLSDKAVSESAHGRIITQDNLEMCRIVYGDIETGGPVMGDVINASSPLRFDQRMLGGLITYARAGQVTYITPFILAGAMGPITVAGALAQQNAEALAGVALTQLVRAGAPVMMGGFTTNADMKSGSPAFGTPEGAWALLAGAQLARRYGLPYRGSGSLTTANLPDAQSAFETQWTLWPAVMAHSNLIMHACGWLEGGLTASFEKFIMDLESLAQFQHFIGGFAINADTLALEMIHAVGPGGGAPQRAGRSAPDLQSIEANDALLQPGLGPGNHLGTAHTQARFATEFFASTLGDRLAFETWEAAGAWDAPKRANAIWKEMLAAYEPPPLDIAIRDALNDYVARRERELQGVNLYE